MQNVEPKETAQPRNSPSHPPLFFSSKMLVISLTLTLGHGAVTISKLHLTRSQQGDVNIIEFPFSSH